MPTPVACLLKSPLMTLSLFLNGAMGSRVWLNSISDPAPFAHQRLGLIPFPIKRAAKRLGKASGAPPATGPSPHTGIDSSHGSAMATPTPRRTVRREMRGELDTINQSPQFNGDRQGSGAQREKQPAEPRNSGACIRIPSSRRIENRIPGPWDFGAQKKE